MRNQGYRVDPRLDLGCAILLWIYMILIVHATIVRRRRKPGCWRWPQLESLRWILFCFLLNCPHSGFRRIFGYAEIRRCNCRRLVTDHVQKSCAMSMTSSFSRNLPVSQVYFNAAGRLLATSRQTLLHCHWANTTRPPGPSFQVS